MDVCATGVLGGSMGTRVGLAVSGMFVRVRVSTVAMQLVGEVL